MASCRLEWTARMAQVLAWCAFHPQADSHHLEENGERLPDFGEVGLFISSTTISSQPGCASALATSFSTRTARPGPGMFGAGDWACPVADVRTVLKSSSGLNHSGIFFRSHRRCDDFDDREGRAERD